LKVWQDSCQYLYLPRLLNSDVFVQAVTAGCSRREGFAFASGRDEAGLLGFTFGQPVLVTLDSDSLLVSHEAALVHQQALDAAEREAVGGGKPRSCGAIKLVSWDGFDGQSAGLAAGCHAACAKNRARLCPTASSARWKSTLTGPAWTFPRW
jgi:hypothetical protein